MERLTGLDPSNTIWQRDLARRGRLASPPRRNVHTTERPIFVDMDLGADAEVSSPVIQPQP